MAEINQSVYGAKENWYVPSEHSEFGTRQFADVYYYNQIAADDKLKIKIANYNTLETPITTMRSQIDGQYTSESYLIRNNWKPTEFTMDNSIVQFGIGPQSGLSNQEWWYVDREYGASNPDTNTPPVLKNTDKYDITNMCLATRSNYTPYEFYSHGQGSILGGYDNNFMYWQVIRGQIFGTENSSFDANYSSQWGFGTGYVNTKLVIQIPIKNLKLTPVIFAYNSQLNNYKKFTSIKSYIDEKGSYPNIFCIKAQFHYRSGHNDAIKYDYTFDCYPWFFNPSSFLSGYGYSFNDKNKVYGDNVYYPNRGDRETGEGITVAGRPGYAHGPNGSMLGNEIYWYGHYDSSTTWDFTIGQGGRVLQTPDFKFVLGTKNLFYCDTSSMTNDQITEGIRTQLASFGMFFVDGEKDLNLALDDDKTFLGILENGVGYGKYSNGKKNREQDQWNWDTMDENNYDPTTPPEPGDNPAASTDPLLPVGLGWTLANTGTGIWALTPSEIGQVWKDIFGTTVDLSKFGDQPMNAILSLKWTPFTWSTNGTSPIVLGDQVVNDIHLYPLVNSVGEAEKHGYGQMKFNFNKNFYNARNIQARLFLPFYGYYELPAAQLLSSRLRVDFYYNIPDELGVWIISYDDIIYDFVECSCDMEIPLTGSNAAALKENKRREALTITTQIASTLTTMGNTSLSNLAGGALVNAVNQYGGLDSIMSSPQGSLGSKLSTAAGYVAGKFASTVFPYGAVGGTGGVNVYNTAHNAQIQRAALKTNLPYHGSALQTTFLHMSMKPYVQIFKNAIMDGLTTQDGGTVKEELGGTSKAEYMLKVGHACNIFTTMDKMLENSLLQTTGMANMSTAGMELAEVNELNAILQSGFYR